MGHGVATSVRIFEENPEQEKIDLVANRLREGGVVIYPTDTLYGIGCAIDNPRAVERIIQLKGLKSRNAQFSFICHNIAQIAEFALISDTNFQLLKKNLPGPFTFILPGLSRVPSYFISKRKTVGVRIPANSIPRRIVAALGVPILTTSIPNADDPAYSYHPELIAERWASQVDLIIDGGTGGETPSTVVDCTGAEVEILRRGKGVLQTD